jgi:hypothetical protein
VSERQRRACALGAVCRPPITRFGLQAAQSYAADACTAQATHLILEDDGRIAVRRHILDCAGSDRAGRLQPILATELDKRPDVLVFGNQLPGVIQLRGRPMSDIAPDAEHTLHRHVEAELQRCDSTGLIIRHVRHPVSHDPGCMRATVAVLNIQPVGGIRVVAGPDLIGPAQRAQVRASAAARA